MLQSFARNKEPKNGRLREINNDIPVKYLGIREELNEVNIYTDGSSKYRASSVGYSFIVININNEILKVSRGKIAVGKKKKNLSALYAETIAVLKAVEYVLNERLDNVKIYTDNLYIFKAVKGYDKCLNPVLHAFINRLKDLVTTIYYGGYHIDIQYVKGHSGIVENELADFYAKDAIKKKNNWTSTTINTANSLFQKLALQ